MSELARLQTRFADCLLKAGDAPSEQFSGTSDRTGRLFGLYRGNLTANWEKSLGNAYPVMRMLVGEEFFRALAREFGRATPLVVGDLNRFGDGLAGFLEGFAPVADYPYLSDMARLEWALHRAHFAADTPALGLESLAEMDADALDDLRLRLREACTLICSIWAVGDIWQAHQPDGPVWPEDVAQPARCLICRPNWRAEVMPLGTGEFAALQAIQEGTPLGAALETAADLDPTFDPAAELPRWIAAGIFSALRSEEDENENPL